MLTGIHCCRSIWYTIYISYIDYLLTIWTMFYIRIIILYHWKFILRQHLYYIYNYWELTESMSEQSKCTICRESLPHPNECNYCGRTHCMEHRLPEKHNCSGGTSGGSQTNEWFDRSISSGRLRSMGSEKRSTGSRLLKYGLILILGLMIGAGIVFYLPAMWFG